MAADPRQAAAEAVYNAILKAQRDAGDVGAEVSAALELLAEGSGENRFRFAASVILGGVKLGRHAIDARESLRRVKEFPAARRRDAVGIVARDIAGPGASPKQVKTIARRLQRKLKRQIGSVARRHCIEESA